MVRCPLTSDLPGSSAIEHFSRQFPVCCLQLLFFLSFSKSLFSASVSPTPPPQPRPSPALGPLACPPAFYTAAPLTSAGILPVMQSLCPDGQRDEFGFLQYANST